MNWRDWLSRLTHMPPALQRTGLMQRANALPALAVALGLLLALELFWPGYDLQAGPHPLPLPATAAQAENASAPSQRVVLMLARPLFSPARRPAGQAQAAETAAALPRLAAIIISGGTSTALFAVPGQKAQAVGVGGQINGYQLLRVAPDRVELLGPDGGHLTLRPERLKGGGPANPPASTSNSS